MRTIEFIKKEAINWLLILLPIVYIFLVNDKLPRFSPFHINREQSTYHVIFIIMGAAVFFYIKLLVQPSIVPKMPVHDNLKSVHRMKTIMLAYTSILCLALVSEKAGMDFNWEKFIFILGMIFLIFLGNLYPTLRYNYFFGIRNSWTLSNELIWKKTHLFSGRLNFWSGLAGAIIEILYSIPKQYMYIIIPCYILINFVIVRFYSYSIHRKFP